MYAEHGSGKGWSKFSRGQQHGYAVETAGPQSPYSTLDYTVLDGGDHAILRVKASVSDFKVEARDGMLYVDLMDGTKARAIRVPASCDVDAGIAVNPNNEKGIFIHIPKRKEVVGKHDCWSDPTPSRRAARPPTRSRVETDPYMLVSYEPFDPDKPA